MFDSCGRFSIHTTTPRVVISPRVARRGRLMSTTTFSQRCNGGVIVFIFSLFLRRIRGQLPPRENWLKRASERALC